MSEISPFLTASQLPFCKGCGHHLVARNTVRALEALNLSPLDVVLVTDIGCHGIAEREFTTHTVHGLHGRSVALAAGIALGLPEGDRKKVIVYLGDGGAIIGLQHLLVAARYNVDITVILHNNMLYGMTGGQPSGLTPQGFRTVITPGGSTLPPHHLCQLVQYAGAPYARRVFGQGNFSDAIREALEVEGFSLVEVLELCPSHGAKMNPGMRLKDLAREAGYEPGFWKNEPRPPLRLVQRGNLPSLLDDLEPVRVRFASPLPAGARVTVVLSGSAGEGVQMAAEFLAQAAMASGLYATKKGSYPVTVGTGFSEAEVVLSRDPIDYHGVSEPDMVIVTSEDGLQRGLSLVREMTRGIVWLDASLPAPDTGAEVRVRQFRKPYGGRNAALSSVLTFARETGLVPAKSLTETIRNSSIGPKLPADLLAEAIP